jgi:hypothetical protein
MYYEQIYPCVVTVKEIRDMFFIYSHTHTLQRKPILPLYLNRSCSSLSDKSVFFNFDQLYIEKY